MGAVKWVVAIGAAFVVAQAELAEEIDTFSSSGETSWQRLDRYQDGRFLVNLPDGYKADEDSHCFLVDETRNERIRYIFEQSSAYFASQDLITPVETVELESSLPHFVAVNLNCGHIGGGYIRENVVEFDSFEDYKAYARDDINAVSRELKELANQEGVRRFSTLYSTGLEPRALRN